MSTVHPDAAPPTLPERYTEPLLLGSGGLGTVWKVRDRVRGEHVALKVLTELGADQAEAARYAFEREFWAMATLRHAGLVPAYDYGELAAGRPFFTMAWVPGHDLDSRLPQPEAEVRGWLPGLAAALAYLHGQGFVHGDLKPANIRLQPDGKVKLMDLGLLERVGRAGGAIRGSLQYLAPEAIQHGVIDLRTDLYALGAVLYHVLTGSPPFAATGVLALLQAQLSQRPAAPSAQAPGTSGQADAAIARLLAKDPAGRYASVAALCEALDLRATLDEAAVLLASPWVGGGDVPQQLAAACSQPGWSWLGGPAGAGKSRLLGELGARAQLAGLRTTAFKGQANDAPYGAVSRWLRQLVETASLPAALLDRLVGAMRATLPELALVRPRVAAAPPLEPLPEQQRFYLAVVELVAAAQPGPHVWLVDDADRLDAESRALLSLLALRAGGCWIMAGRGEAPTQARAYELPAASPAEVAQLAEAQLGEAPPPEVLARLALGADRPGLVEQLLERWIAAGDLVRAAGRWQLAPSARLALPPEAPLLAEAWWGAEAPEVRSLSEAAAIAGPSGELPALAAAAGLSTEAFFGALARLEARGLVMVEATRYALVEPGHAELLAATLLPERSRLLHDRLAAWWQAKAGADPEAATLEQASVLARHLLAGSTPARGLVWAEAGGSRAMKLHAIALAASLTDAALACPAATGAPARRLKLRSAQIHRLRGELATVRGLYEALLSELRGAGPAEAPELTEALTGYGVVLLQQVQYPEAQAVLFEAVAAADHAGLAAPGVRARVFAGRVALLAGDTGLAVQQLDAAVVRARRLAGAEAQGLLAWALGLDGLVMASHDPARSAEGLALIEEAAGLARSSEDWARLRETLANQGNLLLLVGRPLDALSAYREVLGLCERTASANESLFARLNLAAVELELGRVRACAREAAIALDLARTQQRRFPEGYALALLGRAELAMLTPGLGLERLATALETAQAIGSRYLELHVRALQAEALAWLGRQAPAAEAARLARELAQAIQNDELRPVLERVGWQLALESADAVALGEVEQASEDPASPARQARALDVRARARLLANDAPGALAAAQAAAALARSAGVLGLAAEAQALVGTLSHATPTAARSAFEQALALAVETGDSLVELIARLGLAAHTTSHPGLPKAARQQAAAALEAMTPAERAAFFARPERRQLEAALAGGQGAIELGRIERVEELLEAITGEVRLEQVFELALNALVELAEAERGYMVLYDGYRELERHAVGAYATDELAFSSTIAEQVLFGGEPLFIEDVSADAELGSAASVQALNLRSVLALPLKLGERTMGVLITDSRRVRRADWGPHDVALALVLARASTLAIAHARRAAEADAATQRATALEELASSLLAAPDEQACAEAALRAALAAVGADRGFWFVADEPEPRQAVAPNDPTGQRVSRELTRWALAQQVPEQIVDAEAESAFVKTGSVMALGLQTVFAVPLEHQGTSFGALVLDSQRLLVGTPELLEALGRIGRLMAAGLAGRSRA